MTENFRRSLLAAAAVAALSVSLAGVSGVDAAAPGHGATGATGATVPMGRLEVVARDGTDGGLVSTRLVSDRRGDVALVWDRGSGPVTAVRRTPGGRWGRQVELGGGAWADAAMDARGGVTVAWWRSFRHTVVSRRSSSTGWGPEVIVSKTPERSGHFVSNPWVAMNSRGDAVVMWRRLRLGDFFDRPGRADRGDLPSRVSGRKRGWLVAPSSPSGGWLPPEWVPRPGTVLEIIADRRGRAVVVRRTPAGVSLLTRISRGSWTSGSETAAQGSEIWEKAHNSRGDLVLSATAHVAGNLVVQALQKNAASGWQGPLTLAECKESSYRLPVVLDEVGHAAILFLQTDGAPAIVTRDRRGHWSTPATFAGHSSHVSALRLAAGPHGALTALWREGPDALWAAYRAGAAKDWSEPVQLTSTHDPGHGAFRPDVTFAGDRFLAVWGSNAGAHEYFLGRTIGHLDRRPGGAARPRS